MFLYWVGVIQLDRRSDQPGRTLLAVFSRFVVFLVCATPIACEVSVKANRSVEVVGGANPDDNARIARRVVARVNASDMRRQIVEKIPSLDEEQLDGLDVSVKFLAAQRLTSNSKPVTSIFIQCSYEYVARSGTAARVVEICEAKVEAVLERVLNQDSREAQAVGEPVFVQAAPASTLHSLARLRFRSLLALIRECAVRRRRFSVGQIPPGNWSLQPVAIGAVVEVVGGP